MTLPTRVLRAQGWYYLVGGVWPLLHFRSFEAVAGPKPDRFQTEVTAALFAAIGAALLAGTARRPVPPEVRVLSGASALATAWVDRRHRHEIRRLFQAEAALEAVFAVAACGRTRP